MRIFRKIRRLFRLSRITKRLSVWTKDARQRVYYYDIRVCPTSDPARFLVRFDRTGISTGNSMRFYRVLGTEQVRELMLQSV